LARNKYSYLKIPALIKYAKSIGVNADFLREYPNAAKYDLYTYIILCRAFRMGDVDKFKETLQIYGEGIYYEYFLISAMKYNKQNFYDVIVSEILQKNIRLQKLEGFIIHLENSTKNKEYYLSGLMSSPICSKINSVPGNSVSVPGQDYCHVQ
jgi:hypothetical protein